MAYRYDYNPPPGKITPEKYTKQGLPAPGTNYMRLGEQPGYTYNPYDDLYHPSKEGQAAASGESTKETGLMGSLLPIAGASAAYAVGQGIAKDPSGYTSGVYNGIKDGYNGLFGTTPATTTGQTAGTTVAQESAQTAAQAPVAQSASSSALSSGSSSAVADAATGAGVQTTANGTMTVAAGETVPAGYTAVGTAADGSTMVAADGAVQTGLGLGGGLMTAGLGAYAGWQGMQAYNKLKDEDTRSEGALQGYLLSNPFTFWLAPFANKAGLKDNRWKDERKKFANLAKKDVFIPDPVIASLPTHARSLGSIQEEIKTTLAGQGLPEDYVGFDKNGNWVNAQFAKTRDVKDLRAEDIVNYATFAEKDNEWFKKPLQQRLDIANQALQAGAVKEGRGTIAVDWKKFEGQAAPTYGAATGNPTLQREQGQGPSNAQPQTINAQQPTDSKFSGQQNSMAAPNYEGMTAAPGQIAAGTQVSDGAMQRAFNPGMIDARMNVGAGSGQRIASIGGRATKGTRLSPGVYSDGKGGTYRK